MLRNPRAAALWSNLKLERFTLSQVNEALAQVASGRTVKVLVVPTT
jgi:hypothetical protein